MNTVSEKYSSFIELCKKEGNGFIGKSKHWGPVFLVNMIVAFVVYGLLMNHQLVNQLDGMWHGSVSYASTHELSIGRWFWRFLDRFRKYLSPDPVTSVISLIFFTVSFILILDIFEVRSRLAAYLSSLLFTVNISVLASLSYRYMSPTFAVSCFLAVLSAYIIIKFKNPFFVCTAAPLAISLMLGLYQADLGCICLVILLYISLRLYRNDISLKGLGLFLLKTAVVILLGFLLYYILLRVNLRYFEVEMDSYNGADSYGPIGAIMNLPGSFPHTYADFIDYYRNHYIRSNIFSNRLYILFYLVLGIHFAKGAVTLFKKNKVGAILFALTFLLIPPACNAVLMVAYNSFTSIQMTIPVSLCIPVLICLASEIPVVENWAGVLYRIAATALGCLLLYGNYLMTIYDQQAMYMGMNSTKELASEISAALQMYNLYHPYYKYVFVGSPADSPLFAKNFVYEEANEYALIGTWDPEDTRWVVQSWQGLWTYEMGINLNVADDDKLEEALADETVRSMPVFPEYGSCALINDVVVVKLSDNYTPVED